MYTTIDKEPFNKL